jgi:hypothetical protein
MALIHRDNLGVWKPNLPIVLGQLHEDLSEARTAKCSMPPAESFNMMNFMSFVALTAQMIVSTANTANNNNNNNNNRNNNNDNNNNANTNMFVIMIMNANTNDVGGRRFARGARNPPVAELRDCTCDEEPPPPSLIDQVDSVLMCMLKKLTKQSWLHAHKVGSLDSRLLSLLLALNVGNRDGMDEEDMRLLLAKDYNCERELFNCPSISTLLQKLIEMY